MQSDLTPQQLNQVFDEIDRLYALAVTKAGLAASAFDILYALITRGDGCSQTELTQRCWMGKQTLNSAIKKLLTQEIITLESGHGRETLVTFTESGKQFAQQKIEPFLQAEQQALSNLTLAERQTLLALLHKMRDSLRQSFASAELIKDGA